MKLARLDLTAFGCFTDVRLDFSPDDARVHVIYGENEAGKSTALRALGGLLYGIELRSPDDFLHKYERLRIGGELVRADGRSLRFTRRKRHQHTLLDAADEPLPDRALTEFLGGTPEEIFRTVFRLDHEGLVRGGLELREGHGDLAASLFQAGAGIASLRRVQKELAAQAEEIFKPRGRELQLNRAITRYKAARETARTLSLKPADWAERATELRALESSIIALRGEEQTLEAQRRRLDRLQQALPRAGELRELTARRDGLGVVILLPPEASRDREDAQRRERDAALAKESAERKIREIESALTGLAAPRELLEHASAIAELHQTLGSYRQAQRDGPKLRAEAQRLRAEAEAMLADLRPGATLAEAGTLQLSSRQGALITRLAAEHPVVRQGHAAASARHDAASRELTEASVALAALPAVAEVAALRRAVERARAAGDLDEQMHAKSAQAAALEKQAATALGRMKFWRGDAAALEVAPVPLPETVERFAEERAAMGAEAKLLAERAEEAGEKTRQAAMQIETLRRGGSVPTEAELEAKRARRETGWRLIKRAWQSGAPDAEAGDFSPGQPLSAAYEEAVEAADLVSDRLRREADRVAQLAALETAREASRAREETLAADRASIAAKERAWQDAWEQAWRGAGIEPGTPREMTSWLARHAEWLQLVERHRAENAQVKALAGRSNEHIEELRAALEAAPRSGTLGQWVALAAEELENREAARRRRDELEKEIARLTRERDQRTREQTETAAALNTWEQQWSAAVAPLALPGRVEAGEAVELLQRVAAFRQRLAEAEASAAGAERWQAVSATFAAEATRLASAVAGESADLPPEQMATALHRRLAEAEKNAATRAALEKQLAEARKTAAASTAQAAQAGAELAQLLASARCAGVEQLVAAEQKSTEARSLETEIARVKEVLIGFSGAVPLAQFLDELSREDADRLPAQIAELAAAIGEKRAALAAAQEQLGATRGELARMDGSDAAAEAAEAAQGAAAEIGSLTDDYLRLRLACEILSQQIERYRVENEAPILARAKAHFATITRGRFSALRVDLDDKGRPILLGVRSSGGDPVRVEAMSEGTRDQLYFALRVASLERQMEECEPLPFVLDDVLISFDDERASATLGVLAELSQNTQVLFFTHHRHLVELAAAAIPPGRLAVHELAACGGAPPA